MAPRRSERRRRQTVFADATQPGTVRGDRTSSQPANPIASEAASPGEMAIGLAVDRLPHLAGCERKIDVSDPALCEWVPGRDLIELWKWANGPRSSEPAVRTVTISGDAGAEPAPSLRRASSPTRI